ncbi:MAG: universal stress protein [Saprospiraceae bacterium]|nr:universal stress protein [Saprospiraceae bacterium]
MLIYKISKILVPIDFSSLSDNALRHAEQLAHFTTSDIELLHILHPDEINNVWGCQNDKEDYLKFIIIETKVRLKQLASLLIHKRIRTFLNAKIGKTANCVVNAANESQSDLIVIGHNNKTNTGKLNSQVVNIIRNANCPVITIPPEAESNSLNKIIIPICDQPFILDKIKYALSFVKGNDSAIHLVIFYPNFDKSDKSKKISRLFEQALELLKSHRIKIFYTCIMGGNYVKDTLLVAKKQKANLIMILTHHTNFFQQFLRAADEDKFIQKSKIPLMLIPVDAKGLKLGQHQSNDMRNPKNLIAAIVAQN